MFYFFRHVLHQLGWGRGQSDRSEAAKESRLEAAPLSKVEERQAPNEPRKTAAGANIWCQTHQTTNPSNTPETDTSSEIDHKRARTLIQPFELVKSPLFC
jgi:hypothetical protein